MSDSTEVDIFISCARRDNSDDRVSGLVTISVQTYRSLTGGEELKVFFDTTQIHGMDDWEHRLLGGLRAARLLVTFLSPSYFASPAAKRPPPGGSRWRPPPRQWRFSRRQRRGPKLRNRLPTPQFQIFLCSIFHCLSRRAVPPSCAFVFQ
jgi:hypothetical protein